MIKKKTTSKSHKAIIIVATIILAIAIPASIIKVYKVTTVNELRQLAYQFKPDDSWVKTGEYSNEPNLTWLGCIDSVCPMYEISWDTQTQMTKEQIRLLLTKSGWAADIEGDCLPDERFGGPAIVCSAKMIKSNNIISAFYRLDSRDRTDTTFTVRITR